MGIENLAAEGPVEALDVGVLGRLAWLDLVEPHAIGLGPSDELGGLEFGKRFVRGRVALAGLA